MKQINREERSLQEMLQGIIQFQQEEAAKAAARHDELMRRLRQLGEGITQVEGAVERLKSKVIWPCRVFR